MSTVTPLVVRMGTLTVRAAATAIFAATALIAILASSFAAPPPASAAEDSCPAVQVVFARGTNEAPGVGATGQAFVDALNAQAFTALRASPGARAFYDELRARGIEHNDALRRLANRLVGILHGCLKTGTLYDEATAWGHRENLPQSSVAA